MGIMDYGTTQALGDIALMYGVVAVVSLLVAVVIRLIVVTLSRRAEQGAAAVALPARPAPAVIPPQHVAVIAAGVAAMTGAHRIVRIEPAAAGQSWTAVTRVTHHTSHAPRKAQ
jgi:hypothetical protein